MNAKTLTALLQSAAVTLIVVTIAWRTPTLRALVFPNG